MPEEIGSSIENLSNVSKTKYGDLEIISGTWCGNSKTNNNLYVSFAWSGWGKVSAARAATRIIGFDFNNFPIEFLIFTGVAGAVNRNLKQWDIVIASKLIQHDMDARPLFDKYVIAQVATQEKIPCQIVRVISDQADSASPSDFTEFMEEYIQSSAKLVKILLNNFI